MNAIFAAIYLPSRDKIYVVEQLLNYCRTVENATVYIGIQYGSINETEVMIKKAKGDLSIRMDRVVKKHAINSDASAFMVALRLYKEHKAPIVDLCYFVHTKGITTGMDELREALCKGVFAQSAKEMFQHEKIGSHGVCISINHNDKDVQKMSSISKFMSYPYKPMHYFYAHTFYIIRGSIIKQFVDNVSNDFYTTYIPSFSDRYFFERDFIHIVDMQGFYPSYQAFFGNYTDNFKQQNISDFENALKMYLDENDNK